MLYYLSVKQYSTVQVGMPIRGTVRPKYPKAPNDHIHKKLQRAVYDYLFEKLENDYGSLTLREREFLEEYEAVAESLWARMP